MDFLATGTNGGKQEAGGAERREAQRFTSLIRAAKLTSASGEFVCVIRDVSATGISLRCFHALPSGDLKLTLQNGETYPINRVRVDGHDASFTFPEVVDVEHLIVEASRYPKRQLRINLLTPAMLATALQRFSATIVNVSQQGAQVECEAMFAIEQPVRLEAPDLPEIRAKIRWRKSGAYGLAFDNTFTLREFAGQVAAIQCPDLLIG